MAKRRSWWWKLALALVAVALIAAGVVVFVRSRGPSPSLEEFCSRMALAQELDTSFARLDVDEIERQVGSLRAASRVAPAEIAPQVREVLALTEVVAAAVANNPAEPAAAVSQALRDRREQLPAVAEAGQAVESYTAANCGIQLGS